MALTALGYGNTEAVRAVRAAVSYTHLETTAMTINIVCGSGLKSVALAANQILAGESEIVVCGGTENMSAAPYAVPSARWGARMNLSLIHI